MAKPLTEIVPESTHLKVTIAGAIAFLVSVLGFEWQIGAWAGDIKQTTTRGEQNAQAISQLTSAVNTLSMTVQLQAQTVTTQQASQREILEAVRRAEERQSAMNERLIRIESKVTK